MLGIFAAAFSYVAALMGAGFASGQEVVTFFVVFGRYGIIGIAVASLLIGVFGSVISEYAMRNNEGYTGIISKLIPRRIGAVIQVLTFVYSISVIAVMLACFGEIGTVLYGVPRLMGAVILAAVCIFLLLKGSNTALKFNGAIGAVLFIATASVCLFLLGYREHQTFSEAGDAAVSGGVYAGYNLISVGTVLASGRMFLRKKNDGILCGAAAGVMIFLLLAMMWGIIGIYYGKINLGELPMLTLTLRENYMLSRVYALVIAAAVLTTALSSGMCAVEYIEERVGTKKAVAAVMGVGLALSGAGFSKLIDTVYRYCGYVGIAAAFFVMVMVINKVRKEEKRRK